MLIKDLKDIIYIAVTKTLEAKISPKPFDKGLSVGFRPVTNKEYSEYFLLVSIEDTIERANKLLDFALKLIVDIKGKEIAKENLTLALLFPMLQALIKESVITEEDDIFLD